MSSYFEFIFEFFYTDLLNGAEAPSYLHFYEISLILTYLAILIIGILSWKLIKFILKLLRLGF